MSEPGGASLRLAWLGLVTFLLMLPETLPVPVLRPLVLERFGVSDALTTLFMSANQLGALLAAPVLALWAQRVGRRRTPAILALCGDAVLMQALAHPHDYPTFLLLRAAEGALHISALTLVMSLATDAAGPHRGRTLGALGAGLTLGVALGAAIGGRLGRDQPLLVLHVASGVLAAAAGLAAMVLPHDAPTGPRPRLGELLDAVRTTPGLRAPLLLAFVDRFTVGFFTTGFPLLMAGVHGAPREHVGMLLAAFLLPFAVLSYPAGRLAERWSRQPMVFWGSLIYGLGVLAVGTVPAEALWGLMPGLGIASAVMFVPTLLWLLERAPALPRTTAMAAFHGAGALGFLLGPLCCGFLVHVAEEPGTGYVLAFAVAGLAEILGAWLCVGLPFTARRN